MPRSIVEEGKTIEEAVEVGLTKLKASKTDVDIEIIQAPAAKFFGLKTEPAQVRLTLREQKEKPIKKVGTVSVVEGQLHYSPPEEEGGMAPRVSFSKEFTVSYQGEEVQNQVVLTAGLEPLELTWPESKQPQLDYELQVNPEKTKAELAWKRVPGVAYELVDRPASNQISLVLKKTLIDPPVLSLEDLSHILAIEGIEFGVKTEELTEEMFDVPNGIVTIAAGRPIQPPEQPRISYVFQDKEPQIDLEALRIDHYEAHGIKGVEPGTVLAVKTPGKPGIPGMDVYGKPIPAPPIKDLQLKVGQGAALSEDGLTALATASGLPGLQGEVIRVTSVFELQGDADASTGNITMDDSIVINGNVLESIRIESNTGDIVVNGLVSGAVLRTNGSITVLKNVVRSRLLAGGITVIRVRLLSMLSQISLQMEGLIEAYENIVSKADHLSFEHLIKHLLELKFFGLPKDIKLLTDYSHTVEKECSEELLKLINNLSTTFLGTRPLSSLNLEGLRGMSARVKTQVEALEEISVVESTVTVGYLQNSSIEASGDVIVTGKGSFYSDVLAGNGFKIPAGVFRGGDVTINSGLILAKEMGGPTGIATSAQITTEGEITVSLMHPNVIVALGHQSYKFDDTTLQVKVRLEDGLLAVYSGGNRIHG